jgi:hypothetical protein
MAGDVRSQLGKSRSHGGSRRKERRGGMSSAAEWGSGSQGKGPQGGDFRCCSQMVQRCEDGTDDEHVPEGVG